MLTYKKDIRFTLQMDFAGFIGICQCLDFCLEKGFFDQKDLFYKEVLKFKEKVQKDIEEGGI